MRGPGINFAEDLFVSESVWNLLLHVNRKQALPGCGIAAWADQEEGSLPRNRNYSNWSRGEHRRHLKNPE
jgi:hypothetical protein